MSPRIERQLAFAENGQKYARVTKMLGECRLVAVTDVGEEIRCKIRGNMRRRVYVNPGDWVLVAERDELTSDQSDIIAKYAPNEIAYLKRIGEIKNPPRVDDDDPDDVVAFQDDDEDVGIDDI